MPRYGLKFQTTIPAHLTRTPQKAMEKVVTEACRHMNEMVPGATNRSFHPVYEERKTPIGTVWDLLVVFRFDAVRLPPEAERLKKFHDLQMQIRRNAGN